MLIFIWGKSREESAFILGAFRKETKLRVMAVMLMSIVASISEILSVGALIPLLEAVLGEDSTESTGVMANIGVTSGEPTLDYMVAFCCLLIFSSRENLLKNLICQFNDFNNNTDIKLKYLLIYRLKDNFFRRLSPALSTYK